METAKNDQLAIIEMSIATPAVAEAWVKSIRAPETMTDTDIRMVEAHLVAVMLQFDRLFVMEDSGLASRERTRSHIENTAPYYFGSAYAKNWWSFQMPGWRNTPMEEVAGPIVDALDPGFLADYLDRSRLGPAPGAATQQSEAQ